jgi:hypothetical protein
VSDRVQAPLSPHLLQLADDGQTTSRLRRPSLSSSLSSAEAPVPARRLHLLATVYTSSTSVQLPVDSIPAPVTFG